MKVKELKALLENCNENDEVFLKLWNTDLKRDVIVKTERNDGYSYDGYIVISTEE